MMRDEQRQHEQVQVAPPAQPTNAWGNSLASIPSERQGELRALADLQRDWAARPQAAHL